MSECRRKPGRHMVVAVLCSCSWILKASSAPAEAPAPAELPVVQYRSPPPAHAGRYYFDPVDPAFFANITKPVITNYNATHFIEANSSSINPTKVTPSNGTFVLNNTVVGDGPAPAPTGSGAGVESSLPDVYDFAMALNYSLLFYEAQRSGPDWPNNRIDWRSASALDDQNPDGGSLTGGWYDAGDHLILNFPAAFSATVLAYGLIEFGDAYAAAGQTDYAMSNLRWVADYFVKCHYSDVLFAGQVGDVGTDHGTWSQAEALPTYRPSFFISPSAPGSDLLGETAAALAAISMVFESTDANYAATLEAHARDVYALGTAFEGKYSNSISQAYVYPSSNFLDDLAFGAAWLFRKTGEEHFLDDAENYWRRNRNEEGGGGYLAFSWDTAVWGVDMMLTQLTSPNNQVYQNEVIRFLESWVTGSGGLVYYTPGGLAWASEWGTLRYTFNAAFIAVVFAQSIESSNLVQSRRYSCWARGQAHYLLGSNPKQYSYMVGYGDAFPRQTHHRGSSCPNVPTVCNYDNFNLQSDNPHIIYGAMVGGPDRNDAYTDSRSNYQQAEPAVDYNAGLTGVLAYLAGTGDTYASCRQRGDVVNGPRT
ncbi:hypothetical protein WJX74_003790 [Apatococcus lobatus]|uniref:Endoglucanase n=1 Tax=Apatococcus lobatus TaxID=904363 RepID=A0AAW1SFY8_9CHLO